MSKHTFEEVTSVAMALPLTETGRTVVGEWLEQAPPAATVGVAAWLKAHNGSTVDTLQYRVDGTRPWVAMGRKVSARATFATFDGSRRDYAGMHVIASDGSNLIASNDDTFVLYRVAQ